MNLLARSACKETRTELSFKAFTTWILFHPFVLWFFLFLEHKVRVTGGGSPPPPHFSRGKLFLFKYKAHAESRVPVILHLMQVEIFREISDWECSKCHVRASRFLNFLREEPPNHPLRPKKLASLARVFKGSPQLKLRSAVPANDSLRVFPKKSKSWWSPSLWLLKLAISGTAAAITIYVEKPMI